MGFILEKFKEELPSKRKFQDYLTGKNLSGKESEHALNVWKKSEMKTMKSYHDLYLKCKNLLSANVFKKFRNYTIKNYGKCLSHYLSAPGLSWMQCLQ